MLQAAVKAILRTPFLAFANRYPQGERITRFYMYRHMSEIGAILSDEERKGRALSVSGSEHLCEVIGLKPEPLISADYPEYNILNLPFPDDSFDVALFDQVLEHVEGDPQAALDELCRVLKPGGVLFCATVLVYPIHGYPSDFWRFTPNGLKLLCRRFSNIIDFGGWGNMYAWFVVWLGLGQRPVPICSWHPLYRVAMKNDDNWKIVTWIVARK